MEKLIAYCGLDCTECDAYKATQTNDQALREKIAADWTKMHGFNFLPEMINCTSCKSSGAKIGHCSDCEMRKCASGKNLKNCGACSDFKTCKTINDFITMVPGVMGNF